MKMSNNFLFKVGLFKVIRQQGEILLIKIVNQ